MDKETAKYIITYFSNLLTSSEAMAIRHFSSTYKLEHSKSDKLSLTKMYHKRGWLTSDESVLDLLKDGYELFELNVATRILKDDPTKVFFNYCPNCTKLARTPYARQCKHCGHTWHEVSVAKFKLNHSFQLTGRPFFLLGEITKGEIKLGQFIDLTLLGLTNKPKIEVIEFVRNTREGKVVEDIVLGTSELSEEDKEYLKNKGSFGTALDILSSEPLQLYFLLN